jgi:folate-binding protein YgfZ
VKSSETLLIYRYTSVRWLHVTGTDAFSFLQGQCTADLRPLAAGAESVYTLWLNHKGRVQADGFVLAGRGHDYWIASYASPGEALRTRLESFVIADDVVIVDEAAAWAAATVIGGDPAGEVALRAAGGFAFSGRRGVAGAREWVFPRAAEAAVALLSEGAREVNAEMMEAWRIAAGIPAVPQDIGPGELPNEGGLERDAVSFTKGCYLGQEVMARLHTMGRVRRRLMRVRGAGAAPSVPAPLEQGGRVVGELRSAVATENGFAGLALLTLLSLDPTAPLTLASDAAVAVSIDPSS